MKYFSKKSCKDSILLVSNLIAQDKAENTGEQDADGGLDQVEHIHQRRNILQHLRIHARHVFQADAQGFDILQR